MQKIINKIAVKIPLERKDEVLDQYDYFEDEVIYELRSKYGSKIGQFIIAFSNLEQALNILIAESINQNTHALGHRVVRYLEFGDKIKLAKDQYDGYIGFLSDEKRRARQEVIFKLIIDRLIEVSEFRNKVAHANWMTLNEDGFVRVDSREGKQEEGLIFRMFKITPAVLKVFTRRTELLTNLVDMFKDGLDDEFQRQERKFALALNKKVSTRIPKSN
jgi:hypothetical protein